MMCKGTEASLLDCGYQDIDNCGGDEGAGVICSGIGLDPGHLSHIPLLISLSESKEHDDKHDHDHSKIELRGGSSPAEGNVFMNGKPVCDDMWDKNDATVACRMLGYVFNCMTCIFMFIS